jgi:phosphosulfolactate synthase
VLHPTFLTLPPRPGKPRATGLTHVLDKGLPVTTLASLIAAAGEYIEVWKFGWGTAYLDAALSDKLELLARSGIKACLGGTLLEIAWSQGKAQECLDWASRVGFPSVEVSRGVVAMPPEEKWALIRAAASRFVVLSEVGAKDRTRQLTPAEWLTEAEGDLAAGASWVIAEGRESGTEGLYDPSGRVREEVVDAVAASGVDRVFFEAPRKDQQAWFIRRFGPGVNLANVAWDDVLSVESLRLGLRADTVGVGQAELLS